MKKLYTLSIAVIASAICLLTACSRAEIDEVVLLPNGDYAQVALNFDVKSSVDVTTRAAQSEYYEYLVNNIYVFIFNGNRRVKLADDPNDKNGNPNFFSKEEISNYKNKFDDLGSQESSGTIEFGAISGAGLKICIIANVGVSNSKNPATRAGDIVDDTSDVDLQTLDNITTYTQLQSMSLQLKDNSISRNASFLMTGEENNVTLKPYDKTNASKTEITVNLYRTDAKVTFNVTSEPVSGVTNFQFVPLKWRVVNVPVYSYILPHFATGNAGNTLDNNADATSDDVNDHFFTTFDAQFEGKVSGASSTGSGTFTFYMYENLKAPASEISGSDAAAYALREKQTKTVATSGVTGQRYVNGDYVYAPKRATYVVLSGQISYTEKDANGNDKFVMADVEYSIHLGHGSDSNVNSYNTLRNCHYTYNVKVKGVNDIIVEVDDNQLTNPTDSEPRPGAEGDVVMSATELVEVDGHYDRALITLTKEEARQLMFAVSTPWERGLDTNNFNTDDAGNIIPEANTTFRDYKWVKFLINSEAGRNGVADNHFAAYPGDQCYDGGKTETGTAHESGAYNNQKITLRDIRQLSNYFAANPPTSDVTITMFIDEYLYYYNPTSDPMTGDYPRATTYKGVTDADADLTLWKKSVNADARMMHIVKSGDMVYSADGESSISRSVVTIKQKPILSVYNINATELTSAWGTETVNETPKMTSATSGFTESTDSSYANIYINAQKFTVPSNNNSMKWADYISDNPNESDGIALKSGKKSPQNAPLLRNRDLNGDGIINKDEILWYLPGIDQMLDLWIADPIMSADAKMYDPNDVNGYDGIDGNDSKGRHYTTSTVINKDGVNSPVVYWAEEYGSTSTIYQAAGWNQAPGKNNDSTSESGLLSVRVLRNFGIAYKSTDMPMNYFKVTQQPSASQDGAIELTYMNPNALRQTSDNGLHLPYALVDDAGDNNRPYKGFFIKYGNAEKSWSGETVYPYKDMYETVVQNNSSYCPDGYRLPNQREMILMSRTINNWASGQFTVYMFYNGQKIDENQFGVFVYYPNWMGGQISRAKGALVTDINRGFIYSDKISAYNLAGGNPDHTVYLRCIKDNPNVKMPSSDYDDGGEG